MKDCVFCKIVRGEVPKKFRFEDELIVAFKDINPQADVHILFVPKEHVENFDKLTNDEILSSIKRGIQKMVSEEKLSGRGYKIQVFGGGAETIPHLHFHLMGPIGLRV